MQFKILLFAASAALVAAQEPPSLTDALSSTAELSQLLTILGGYPDLVSTLANATNITILAPSDQAFINAAGVLATATPDTIAAILTYHVLGQAVPSSAITETPAFVPTLLTNETYTQVTGGQVVGAVVNDGGVEIISGGGATSKVVTADVLIAGGSVVHIIDTVLTIPDDIATVATSANLTALVDAVTTTNLTQTLVTTPDLTVFAPTNEAFAAIQSTLATLTVEEIAAILSYHVVAGTVAYSSTLSNTSIATLAGSAVNISIVDGDVYVNAAKVVLADVIVANGIVHVIDSVLNPNATTGPSPTAIPNATVPAASASSSAPATFTGAAPRVTGAVAAAVLFGAVGFAAQM